VSTLSWISALCGVVVEDIQRNCQCYDIYNKRTTELESDSLLPKLKKDRKKTAGISG
jgi:hypothetical protein